MTKTLSDDCFVPCPILEPSETTAIGMGLTKSVVKRSFKIKLQKRLFCSAYIERCCILGICDLPHTEITTIVDCCKLKKVKWNNNYLSCTKFNKKVFQLHCLRFVLNSICIRNLYSTKRVGKHKICHQNYSIGLGYSWFFFFL